ncbi:MAG: dihydrofolate reductase, partial [Bacteroidia bacterium]|nr:dihydrofolate reductase [Bacteroidia bacterium]
MLALATAGSAQTGSGTEKSTAKKNPVMTDKSNTFNYVSEQFADLRILRYEIPGFDQLSLQQKELLYYLSEAALCGRDIAWDQ